MKRIISLLFLSLFLFSFVLAEEVTTIKSTVSFSTDGSSVGDSYNTSQDIYTNADNSGYFSNSSFILLIIFVVLILIIVYLFNQRNKIKDIKNFKKK